jgi:integrase
MLTVAAIVLSLSELTCQGVSSRMTRWPPFSTSRPAPYTTQLDATRSCDRETTRGGHADVIPIAAEHAPYLKVAIEASPSDLVFPSPDGTMMSKEVGVEHVLRRALARAGIVLGYRHVCRARVSAAGKRDPKAPRCAHVEATPDRALRRCPVHNDLLWPRAVVRPLRFHDLRHTTASLLMQSGANPAAVQRILRHSDPRITTEVYGHLAPGYLRAEVDRLRFGLKVQSTPEQAKLPEGARAAVSTGVLDSVLDRTEKQEKGGQEPLKKISGSPGLESGAGNRIRTGDPQLGKLMLYQLSYSRVAP